jgi:putative colanic acid biosynthesis acetyltransferase WcaF
VGCENDAVSDDTGDSDATIPVIDLSQAPGAGEGWGRPAIVVYLWAVVERLLVTNAWQPSSALRVRALRAFGASIGEGVVFRPRTRVKFPWKLNIGDRCWIGEGVWFHNRDRITIGHDAVISQEAYLATGSHAHRTHMGVVMKPIVIAPGAWVTSRCIVLGGSHIGRSALVTPGSVVSGRVDANTIVSGNPALPVGPRFRS